MFVKLERIKYCKIVPLPNEEEFVWVAKLKERGDKDVLVRF